MTHDFILGGSPVSLITVRACTPKALDWIEANLALEEWQWANEAFVVEPAYACDIVEGIEADGLTVEKLTVRKI